MIDDMSLPMSGHTTDRTLHRASSRAVPTKMPLILNKLRLGAALAPPAGV
jgi:hypothetical protein